MKMYTLGFLERGLNTFGLLEIQELNLAWLWVRLCQRSRRLPDLVLNVTPNCQQTLCRNMRVVEAGLLSH